MKKITNATAKRIISALLCALIILGAVPMITFFSTLDTGAATGQNYVTLPITIRDFAADGMLFNYNELGHTGETPITDASPNLRFDSEATGGSNYTCSSITGGYRYTATDTGINITFYKSQASSSSFTSTQLRYAVLKYKTSTSTTSQSPTIGLRGGSDKYVTLPTDGYGQNSWKTVVVNMTTEATGNINYITIYPRINNGQTFDIAYLAFFDNLNDANAYKAADGVVGEAATYIHGNNLGYGFLATNSDSHLPEALPDANNAIAGSNYFSNGSWGSQPGTVASTTTTLNSGAKMTVNGALIRTNLVTGDLGSNGKPVYTEGTVSFLAGYMQQTLPEVFDNGDGTYNMWYVIGTELYNSSNEYVGPNHEDATRTLADVFRKNITEKGNNLGTYADTIANKPTSVTDCDTYFDAAWFMLHSLFDGDEKGFGQTVKEYKQIHLVENTDANGNTYYVYNSAFTTEYDITNGVISNNSDFSDSDFPARKNENGEVQYVRGNKQPENRFDPTRAVGVDAYYGNNRDYYADLVGAKMANADGEDYYENTNYNLTLEGHAKFIYYYDANQYFYFTGDDDVYLYINGKRVLDIGGAHAIAECGINLNDVAILCGLVDGQEYTFDFFYTERHGTAANFGIKTNIKIVDPNMQTTKTGFQNGVPVGYNGFVDPTKPVIYMFGLQNNGETPLRNLQFADDDIGVNITPTTLLLNGKDGTKTSIDRMAVNIYNPDGSVNLTYMGSEYGGNLTEERLKQLLAEGLEVGERIEVFGFEYLIPEDEWVTNSGQTQFPNTVYSYAECYYANDQDGVQELHGIADYVVQKSEYVYQDLRYYSWLHDTGDGKGFMDDGGSSTVSLTKAELVDFIKAAHTDISIPDGAKLQLTYPSGVPVVYNSTTIGTYVPTTDAGRTGGARLDADGNMTITAADNATGQAYYYYILTYGEGENVRSFGPVRIDVITYGVSDDVFVLDYGLSVDLMGHDSILSQNDIWYLSVNDRDMMPSAMVMRSHTTNYGVYTWADGTPMNDGTEIPYGASLLYTMNKFMEGEDSFEIEYSLIENGATELTKRTGVTMKQKVTVIPANVMYYEDTFSFADPKSIKYSGEDGNNKWRIDEALTNDIIWQSANQKRNYGSDPIYSTDYGVWTSGSAKYSAYASNGTIHTLTMPNCSATNGYAEIMSFDFKGTGFELISRTVKDNYGVLRVTVTDKATGAVVRQLPVITEFKSGELEQVPIFSLMDLSYGEYHVSIEATGTTETVTRVVYVDGLRIYNPLASDDTLREHYNAYERYAEFYEIKKEISNGKIVYAATNGNAFYLSGGETVIECIDGSGLKFVEASNKDDYIRNGPNNEIYLNGSSKASFIAFYLSVQKDKDGNPILSEDERTLQVGVHRKYDDRTGNINTDIALTYGSTADELLSKAYVTTDMNIHSGTEEYYTIDVTKLTPLSDGRYLVMIGVESGVNWLTLVLTNLKVSGYNIEAGALANLTPMVDDGSANTWNVTSEPTVAAIRTYAAKNGEKYGAASVEAVTTKDTSVIGAEFESNAVSGSPVKLTVKASQNAESILILDENGMTVDPASVSVKISKIDDLALKDDPANTYKTFTLEIYVYGAKGEQKTYTVHVYDAEGRLSVSKVYATVTVE